MTRVHFNLIAKGLEESKPHRDEYMTAVEYRIALNVWSQTAKRLALKFTATNPSFNEPRFLEACGVED